MRPKLAISLNASSDEQRDQVMPINRKYPLEKLLGACRKYPLRPWEQLTFEYVLLGGFNDSPEDARRVVRLLSRLRAKVNLIPWNPGELPWERPQPAARRSFPQSSGRQRRAGVRPRFARTGRDGRVWPARAHRVRLPPLGAFVSRCHPERSGFATR